MMFIDHKYKKNVEKTSILTPTTHFSYPQLGHENLDEVAATQPTGATCETIFLTPSADRNFYDQKNLHLHIKEGGGVSCTEFQPS